MKGRGWEVTEVERRRRSEVEMTKPEKDGEEREKEEV